MVTISHPRASLAPPHAAGRAWPAQAVGRCLRLLFVCLCVLLATACSRAPDEAVVRDVLTQRLQATFDEPLLEIAELRRLGSAPLAAASDGAARSIVYYNARFTLVRDYEFSDWDALTPAALATLLGATEPGVEGIRSAGNAAGDELRVRGSVTFRRTADGWEPALFVRPPGLAGGQGSGASEGARQLVEQIMALFEAAPGRQEDRSRAIITEELQEALRQISLRLEQMQRAFVVAGGPAGGEYDLVARTIAAFGTSYGIQTAPATTDGSAENVALLRDGVASVALVQNDVAAMAYQGAQQFAGQPPATSLRALGSLFPEPVQIVVRADGPRAVADLRGLRVDLGLPGSGSRTTALSVLRAHGVNEDDLAAATGSGPAEAAQALARGEIDAFVSVINAPARLLQRLSADAEIRMLPLEPQAVQALAAADPAMVPLTLPAGTYPGQAAPLPTVAVAALLVGRAEMSNAEVRSLLQSVYEGIDFVAAGSAAGAMISPRRARTGLTIPMHPEADLYFSEGDGERQGEKDAGRDGERSDSDEQ